MKSGQLPCCAAGIESFVFFTSQQKMKNQDGFGIHGTVNVYITVANLQFGSLKIVKIHILHYFMRDLKREKKSLSQIL